jgi:hypothetical protein
MASSEAKSSYITRLRAGFWAYRQSRFGGQVHLFEPRPEGGAVVFPRNHRSANLLIPPCATQEQWQQIIDLIRPGQQQRHFGSMQSSQALAQSVFGAIRVLGHDAVLANTVAEDGRPAFGPSPDAAGIKLEMPVRWLGEPRPTSVDVWLGGPYRVAVECKLAETDFGTCSRTRLKPEDKSYETQHCDGTYTLQPGREARCALTEIKVRYWDHMGELFGWASDTDHRPCPLASTYQLARNAMAACVGDDGNLAVDRGHALIVYDQRNPTMAPGGTGDGRWQQATSASRVPGMLRRISWQAFIAQWPKDAWLDWLREELDAKYGLRPA